MMRTNKDKAIEYGITREKIVATFHKNTKVQDDGCIVWTKNVNQNGYGTMGIKYFTGKHKHPQPVYVHRFAWALEFGMDKLPMGVGGNSKGDRLVLNHMCFNRRCVNTNHLEVILQSQNNSPEKRKPKNGAA